MQASPPAVEWRTSAGLVPYPEALATMEERVAAIRERGAPELVWLLEHPPLYTAGTSAAPGELLDAARFPVYAAGRGGRYTYHGPGQRIAYLMLDLKRRGGDIRRFVHQLEELAIRTLADFGVRGERREGRIGIWVALPTAARPRSGRSACGCAAGSATTGWRSTCGRISGTSTASCPVASASMV